MGKNKKVTPSRIKTMKKNMQRFNDYQRQRKEEAKILQQNKVEAETVAVVK